MSKHPSASEETAAARRREAMETCPQDRYARRGKFQFCHQCGSQDGMQAVHREILTEMPKIVITLLVSWYSEPENSEHLFYPCHTCNRAKIVPLVYDPMTLDDVTAWIDERDPMAPDYTALAAEEPVLASEDSRDSAGL